ncbi:hypothetical protein H8K35_14640 [Undibacterium sp. LX40W]|uniref:Uncharacterized protein n=1 Tax=Undibacterium nitidum TaxID=2762298 RepID=A0A923HP55_9BURK|nr:MULTISPECIES: hypothetical protein [Undibacterium]MBC3882627.1 hypothetical protein [Undibacterium nitidum]MBC3892908.1 hypothetical protein [Undibacterium sp. LX40W]
MHQKFKNLANISIVVSVACFGLATIIKPEGDKYFETSPAAEAIMCLAVAAWIFAFWCYAKAKGRSGWLGILLPMLNIVGLIILLLLKDRSDELEEVSCEKCGGKNLAQDTVCRYCTMPLPVQLLNEEVANTKTN